MALVGHVYIQDADPGTPPSGGYEWFKPTSQDIYIRNGANTAWVFKGNAATANLGNLPVAGGAMTSAISGGHGLAPLTSPDFQGTSKRDGKNLALKTDLNAMAASLRSEFATLAASLVAGSVSTSTTRSNLAFGMGTSSYTSDTVYYQIPLPQFPDLTPATEAQCKWIVSMAEMSWFDSTVTGGTVTQYLLQKAGSPREYTAYTNDTGNGIFQGKFHYLIIGVR